MAPQAWKWKGDPDRTDGWTVVGEDVHHFKLALMSYDSVHGATSRPLVEGIPGEMLMPRAKAEELHDRIAMMDEVYWPGFNPTVVQVRAGELVELEEDES